MSKTVLVTGASGFIGKFVVPALAKQGWQVRAAARDPNSILAKPGIEIVAMPDLKDAVDWAPLLDGAERSALLRTPLDPSGASRVSARGGTRSRG